MADSNLVKNPKLEAGLETEQEYEDGDYRHKKAEVPHSRILLITVLNAKYPITTDVLYAISKPYGEVYRIVIFKRKAIQAMIEFNSIESAERAMNSLNGANIYTECCTLKIEWAKQEKLNVRRNTSETYDYTIGDENEKKGLLPDPPQADFGNNSFQTSGGPPLPLLRMNSPWRPSNARLPKFRNDYQEGSRYGGGFNGYDDYNGFDMDYHRGGNFQRNYAPPTTAGVVMLYNLNPSKDNCKRVFNLVCLYGNVNRIRFLKSKGDCAMVEMTDQQSILRTRKNLQDAPLGDDRRLLIRYSRQTSITPPASVDSLEDGTNAFCDFSKNKSNRFKNPEAAAKNRIHPPSKVILFYNAPAAISEDMLRGIINGTLKSSNIEIVDMILFPKKAEANSVSGLLEFNSAEDAVEAIMACNHIPVSVDDLQPAFVLKLCFSMSGSIHLDERKQTRGTQNGSKESTEQEQSMEEQLQMDQDSSEQAQEWA